LGFEVDPVDTRTTDPNTLRGKVASFIEHRLMSHVHDDG
jgi:hypothetical protein